jgi:hypothetical protein
LNVGVKIEKRNALGTVTLLTNLNIDGVGLWK